MHAILTWYQGAGRSPVGAHPTVEGTLALFDEFYTGKNPVCRKAISLPDQDEEASSAEPQCEGEPLGEGSHYQNEDEEPAEVFPSAQGQGADAAIKQKVPSEPNNFGNDTQEAGEDSRAAKSLHKDEGVLLPLSGVVGDEEENFLHEIDGDKTAPANNEEEEDGGKDEPAHDKDGSKLQSANDNQEEDAASLRPTIGELNDGDVFPHLLDFFQVNVMHVGQQLMFSALHVKIGRLGITIFVHVDFVINHAKPRADPKVKKKTALLLWLTIDMPFHPGEQHKVCFTPLHEPANHVKGGEVVHHPAKEDGHMFAGSILDIGTRYISFGGGLDAVQESCLAGYSHEPYSISLT